MTGAQAMANCHGFQILVFSTKELKGIRDLNLNFTDVNRNKTLYLEHSVTPEERSTQDPTSFLHWY